MSKYPVIDYSPLSSSLLGLTNEVITQPYDTNTQSYHTNTLYYDSPYYDSEEIVYDELIGGSKNKKKQKQKQKQKKTKKIDTYKKKELEVIAKNNNVNLKSRDGKLKNKTQLYNSLNRKKLL
jgi:hypothetical protein